MKVKVSVKVASNLKLQSLHDDGENLKMPSNEPNFVSCLLELLTGTCHIGGIGNVVLLQAWGEY